MNSVRAPVVQEEAPTSPLESLLSVHLKVMPSDSHSQSLDDLVEGRDLTDDGLLVALRARHAAKRVYTYAGCVVAGARAFAHRTHPRPIPTRTRAPAPPRPPR